MDLRQFFIHRSPSWRSAWTFCAASSHRVHGALTIGFINRCIWLICFAICKLDEPCPEPFVSKNCFPKLFLNPCVSGCAMRHSNNLIPCCMFSWSHTMELYGAVAMYAIDRAQGERIEHLSCSTSCVDEWLADRHRSRYGSHKNISPSMNGLCKKYYKICVKRKVEYFLGWPVTNLLPQKV